MRAATRRLAAFSSNNSAAAAAAAATTSSPSTQTVFTEISNAVGERNISWRGRSFAASVPAESSNSQKVLKKISKDERRSLLQAFVQKYKASNGGKFPTTSAAQKQVGGSYYVVKKILQEIEYQSKMSPSSKTDASKEECLPLPKLKDVSSSKSTAHLTYEPCSTMKDDFHATVTGVTTEKDAINNFEANEGSSISNEKPLPGKASTPRTGYRSSFKRKKSDATKVEIKEVLHGRIDEAKSTEKEEATFEGPAHLSGSIAKVVKKAVQETAKSDEFERDISIKEDEDQLQKRSNVWGNLRSFADSIINLWRKI